MRHVTPRRMAPARRTLSRRRLVALGGGAAAAIALAACSGGGDDRSNGEPSNGSGTGAVPDKDQIIFTWQLPDETGQATPGGVYRGVTTGEVTGGFDPVKSTSGTTQVLAGAVYETLLAFRSGPGIDPSGNVEVEGQLAEAYEIAPDAQRVTFKMRPNVKFHNVAPVSGRIMEMEDWRQSLERFLAVSPYRASLMGILDGYEFPDERTMVLKLKTPYAPIARLFASGASSFWVMPKEAADGRMNPDTQVIGTNFRQLDTFEPSVTWEHKRHPQYWRGNGRPYLDRWHYPIIPEYAQRVAQFIAGNIYEFGPQPREVLVTRRDAPQTRMFQSDIFVWWGMMYFGLRDIEGAPWRDERVRRAISMMLDRGPMVEHFANSEEYRDAGLPQEVRWHSHVSCRWTDFWLNPQGNDLGPGAASFAFNLAEAKKLLAAAGYPDGFEMDVSYTTDPIFGPAHPERVQITMGMLEKAGIKPKPNEMAYPAFLSQIYRERDFRGMAIPAGETTAVDIDLELYNSYHSAGGRYKIFAKDPRVDAMVEAQRRELDAQKRVGIIHDLQRYLVERMYTVPLDGSASFFFFRWPYLRNAAWPEWNEWLAADTPNRGG